MGPPYILVFWRNCILQHLCADYEQYLSNFKDTKWLFPSRLVRIWLSYQEIILEAIS